MTTPTPHPLDPVALRYARMADRYAAHCAKGGTLFDFNADDTEEQDPSEPDSLCVLLHAKKGG